MKNFIYDYYQMKWDVTSKSFKISVIEHFLSALKFEAWDALTSLVACIYSLPVVFDAIKRFKVYRPKEAYFRNDGTMTEEEILEATEYWEYIHNRITK